MLSPRATVLLIVLLLLNSSSVTVSSLFSKSTNVLPSENVISNNYANKMLNYDINSYQTGGIGVPKPPRPRGNLVPKLLKVDVQFKVER